MKNVYLLIAISLMLLTVPGALFAQGVAINTSGAAAHASSMLDVSSTSSGMLAPRMSAAQRSAISNPATGLLVFQTDGSSGFYYYTGSGWIRISSGINASGTANYVSKFTDATSLGNSQIFDNGTNVGIGTASPSYKLHIAGTGYFINGSTRSYLADVSNGRGVYGIGTNVGVYGEGGTYGVLGTGTNTGVYGVSSNIGIYGAGSAWAGFFNGNVHVSSGNLGLGTVTPTTQLHTTGGVRFQTLAGTGSRIVYADASGNLSASSAAAAGLVSGTGTANYVARWTSSNTISTGIIQDNSTRVGIGTAPHASYLAQIGGDVLLTSGWLRTTGAAGWYSQTYGGGWYMTDATWIRSYGSKSIYHDTGIMRTDGNFQVGGAGSTLNVVNSGNFSYRTDVLFANTSGNVGVGTSSPNQKLHIAAGNVFNEGKILLYTSAGQGSGAHGISWYQPSFVTWFDYMAPPGTTNAPSGTAAPTDASANVTSWARRFNIENNAGYGWIFESGANSAGSAPTAKFAISSNTGNFHSTGSGVVDGTLRAGAYATLGTGTSAGYYQDATNGAYRAIVGAGTTNGYYFQTNAGGTTTMYVGLGGAYNGRVGIGTTTPSFSLHVPSGYIGTDYINTTDNSVSSGVTGIMVKTGDNYHRTATAAAIATFLNATGTWIPNNGSGDWQIASSSTSTGYSAASLELRESNFSGASGIPPRLGFHWGGVVASQIGIESSGRIAILNNPGSSYESLIANNLYANSEIYVNNWVRHNDNDGTYWSNNAWHIYPKDASDMYLRTGSGNGGICGTIGDATARGYLHWTTSNEIGLLDNVRSWQLRSWNGGTEIYDATYNNNAYSYWYRNRYSVDTDHTFGIYFGSDASAAYGIFRESGAWSNPYPDLRIAFHTGIKLGANASYNGIRFYSDYDMATLVMAVNDASTSGANNVYMPYYLGVGTSPGYRVHVNMTTSEQYGIYAYRPYGNYGAGRASIYGYRSGSGNGSSYGVSGTDSGLKGYTYYGDLYAFGVAGHTYGDYTRTGGTMGADLNGTYWAALGYKNSGSTWYGLYYSSTGGVGAGSGYMNNNGIVTGIGSGGYGGVMGGWSRGEVLGFTTAGELYASYNLGNEYTSGVSADIVTNGNERHAAYSVTSYDIKVYGDGKAKLVNGVCYVQYNREFTNLISADNVPTITVSALGECEGVYIVNADKNGFTVKEFRGGQSNVEFSWIAVATRADANELNTLPADIKKSDFDKNLKDVMFNENNKDQSAKPIWWDGNTVRFDAQPEEPKPAKTEDLGPTKTSQSDLRNGNQSPEISPIEHSKRNASAVQHEYYAPKNKE